MKRRAFIWLAGLAAVWPRKAKAVDIWGPIIRKTGVKVATDQYALGWKVLNSEPDKVTKLRPTIADSTETAGKNVLFPDTLATLSAEEQQDFLNHIADWFVRRALNNLK